MQAALFKHKLEFTSLCEENAISGGMIKVQHPLQLNFKEFVKFCPKYLILQQQMYLYYNFKIT
jgi:hypothetical protein